MEQNITEEICENLQRQLYSFIIKNQNLKRAMEATQREVEELKEDGSQSSKVLHPISLEWGVQVEALMDEISEAYSTAYMQGFQDYKAHL